MFVADCSYVRQLLPPDEFVKRQETLIGQVLLAELRRQLTFNIVPPRADYFGLNNVHSLDHWIASHPSVRPCELSARDDWHDWARRDDDGTFEWGLAPHRHSILAVNVNRRVIANTGLRRREYQFLAGHVLKWQSLYNVTPQQQRDDSWVWSWFPDGSLWQQAIVEHGNQAVQVLTAEFAQDGM